MAKGMIAAPSDRKWEVENDLRTLVDAEAIKKDSKRMAACRAMAKEKMAAMGAVTYEK